MSSEVAVRARGLGKAYPIYSRPSNRLLHMLSRGRMGQPMEFWAVHHVDLDLCRGETVGIVGRNGSGKSTLLEMISGTLEPTCGEVQVQGRVAALLGLGAGFNDEFTGRDNVHLSAAILGLTPKEIGSVFDAIVAFADIGVFIDQPVKTYSSGMYARLAFAVAIHTMPDVLILDEILSVGDEAFQRKCFARIEEIKAQGATILFVSHTAASILELCDRAVLLDGGIQLLTGSPHTVITLYQKLLHASPERTAEIRAQIQQEARAPGSVIPERGKDGEETADAETEEREEEWGAFDPSLESRSVVTYPVNGAEIRGPTLSAASGQPVNCLISGRPYSLSYEVVFEKDAFDVRYATLIKTVTGLELGGGTWPSIGSSGPDVPAGTTVAVSFQFTCHLNPGVYFLNCGVVGCGGQQLHRIVDALAFRVLPLEERTTFGHVCFGHSAAVSS